MGSPLAAVLAARTGVSTSPLAVRSIRAQLEVLALVHPAVAHAQVERSLSIYVLPQRCVLLTAVHVLLTSFLGFVVLPSRTTASDVVLETLRRQTAAVV